MGGHASTGGKDSFGVDHTDDVFWGSLGTDKNNLLASIMLGFALFSAEDDGTSASAWGSWKTVDNGVMLLEVGFVEGWVE